MLIEKSQIDQYNSDKQASHQRKFDYIKSEIPQGETILKIANATTRI